MIALDEAHGFPIEPQFLTRLEQGVDPGKQCPIEQNCVLVSRQLRRQLLLQCPNVIIGMGTCHTEEDARDPIQQLTRQLQGNNRVLETGLRRLPCNGVDLRQLLCHALPECRRVMGLGDEIELRVVQIQGTLRE